MIAPIYYILFLILSLATSIAIGGRPGNVVFVSAWLILVLALALESIR